MSSYDGKNYIFEAPTQETCFNLVVDFHKRLGENPTIVHSEVSRMMEPDIGKSSLCVSIMTKNPSIFVCEIESSVFGDWTTYAYCDVDEQYY